MHYSYEAATLPAHTADNPLITEIHLSSGKLRRVEITFPPGCDRRIRAVLLSGSTQILPTNLGGYYSEDGQVVRANVYYDLDEESNLLKLITWGVNAKLTHTLSIRLEVQGQGEEGLEKWIPMLIDTINRMLDFIASRW